MRTYIYVYTLYKNDYYIVHIHLMQCTGIFTSFREQCSTDKDGDGIPDSLVCQNYMYTYIIYISHKNVRYMYADFSPLCILCIVW